MNQSSRLFFCVYYLKSLNIRCQLIDRFKNKYTELKVETQIGAIVHLWKKKNTVSSK